MTGIQFSFPAITQNIIVVWYKNATPTTEAGRSVVYAQSATPYYLVPGNLQPVAYTFKFYTTSAIVGSDPATASLDTLLSVWSIDGSLASSTNNSIEFFHYVVDRGQSSSTAGAAWADPVAGANQINDERLAGKTYEVFFRGTGARRPDEITNVPAGGFILAVSGEVFATGDTVSVIVSSQNVVPPPPVVGEKINLVTANATVDNDYLNASNVALFSSLILVSTFQSFDVYPDGAVLNFSTFTGTQRYWKLQFASAETIAFMGKNRNHIYLGQGESIKLLIKADISSGHNKCYVLDYKGYYDRVGEFIFGNKQLPNTLYANRAQYNMADYPRLIEELTAEQVFGLSELFNVFSNPSTTVHIGNRDITYDTYMGLFPMAITSNDYNDHGAIFFVPDLRNMTLKALSKWTGTDAPISTATGDQQRYGPGAGGLQIQNVFAGDTGPQNSPYTESVGQGYQSGSAPFKKQYVGTNNQVDNIGQYPLVGI